MLGSESPEATLESDAVGPVISAEELHLLRQVLTEIVFREELMEYLVKVGRKTREHQSVLVGAGPRASQPLLLASRAYAAVDGRDFARGGCS